MFSVTIDELLNSDNIAQSVSNSAKTGENEETSESESEDNDRSFRVNVGDKVNIDLNGAITVEDEDGKVNIDLDNGNIIVNDEDGQVKVGLGNGGITVNGDDGVKVKLGKRHIHIGSDDDDDDDDDDDEDEAIKKNSKIAILYKVPYPIVTVIAFLLIGLLADGWYWAWTLFMTIPVYYSLLGAIIKRRSADFAYPVLVAFLYCLLGMLCSWWHPGWIIFITIPVYYPIAEGIDGYFRNRKR